jgi:superfamily II DNA/RNA helicase
MTATSTGAFAQLGVPSFICDALERRGITEPFAIQAATIADGLAGRDVCGRAPTGSGKTLAFGVPLVATTERAAPGLPTALVLAPTRELAEQITIELRSFSGRLNVEAVYGGVGYGKQLSALRRGVDVLVACPGRLEDLIERGDVALSEVRTVVLDEADRMADMGFMPAVKRLLDRTPTDRRTVLFSATLDGDVAELTRDYQRDPVRHEVGDDTPDVTAATHRFVTVERPDRNAVVADVVNGAWPSIVFTRTRHGADRLAKQLGKLGYKASPIHGGLSQNARQRALDSFSKGRVHALIATDVAARGIHVDGVASVIHYDPPEDHKTYVHRAGRTARAGADGLVVSLVQSEQRKAYRRMQREIGLDEPFTKSGSAESAEPQGAASAVPVLTPTGPEPTTARPRSNDRGSSGHRGQRRNGGSGGSRRNDRNGAHGRSDRNDRSDRNGADGRSDRNDRSRGADRDGGHGRSERSEGQRSDRRDDRGGRSQSNGQNRTGQQAAGPKAAGPKRNGPKRTSPAGSSGPSRSGKPKADNRRARRAHLQWDNR